MHNPSIIDIPKLANPADHALPRTGNWSTLSNISSKPPASGVAPWGKFCPSFSPIPAQGQSATILIRGGGMPLSAVFFGQTARNLVQPIWSHCQAVGSGRRFLHIRFGFGQSHTRILLAMEFDRGDLLLGILRHPPHLRRNPRRQLNLVVLQQRIQFPIQMAQVYLLPGPHGGNRHAYKNNQRDHAVITEIQTGQKRCHK